MFSRVIDLEAYFARIGYGGSHAPTLATLNGIVRAHVETIPFELEESWLADVGVGAMSVTPRRLLRENGLVYHQARLGDERHDVCEITLDEMPVIDRIVANWYTSRCSRRALRASAREGDAVPARGARLLKHALAIGFAPTNRRGELQSLGGRRRPRYHRA